MKTIKATLILLAIAISATATTNTFAQISASNTPGASSAKETRAQKRAERKARRAQKNVQLKQLEDQGFKPGGTRIDAPQTLPATSAGQVGASAVSGK